MSERCEQTSECKSEWPSTLCVDFISFETSAPRCRLTSMDGSISFDVDNVADLVYLQQGRDRRHSILAKGPSEHVTSAAPISLGIRHFYRVVLVLIPKGKVFKLDINLEMKARIGEI